MVKINCQCGFLMRTASVPNDIQLMVYTSAEWESMMAAQTVVSRQPPLPQHEVWRCPKCGRIYVFRRQSDQPVALYQLDHILHKPEEWIKHKPEQLESDEYELLRLVQNRDGLQLNFLGEKTEVSVVYKEQLLAFRSCDESDRWKTVDKVLADKGSHFLRRGLVFEVRQSNYARWFSEEKFNVFKPDELLHLAFVTPNDIVDVLSTDKPEIAIRPTAFNRSFL